MSDLISREIIMGEIRGWQEDIHDNEYDANRYNFVFDRIYEIIDEISTVDAVEVVHGHKIIRNRPYAAQYIYVGDDGYGNLVKRTDYSGTAIEITPAILSNPIEYCSECGKRMDGIWQNYCDNCGAKMDEKEYEKNEFD